MKILVIYFSQTDNTRKIAEKIFTGITETTRHGDFKPLEKVSPASLADYDLIGIGAPVFYYKEPYNVTDFLESLPDLNGQHWFVFCTHGNVIGNFFPSVSACLQKKRATVIGYHNCYADITVPFYPKPSYTSGHPDQLDLDRALQFGRDMVDTSRNIRQNGHADLPNPLPISSEDWILASHQITRENLAKMMPKLSWNSATCVQCGDCAAQCPVQGIDLASDPPRLQTPCIYCWHCVNICPTQSITGDWRQIVAAIPDNYARYKKELDQAAAGGEFRWLIDPQTIDLSTPLCRQRKRESPDQ